MYFWLLPHFCTAMTAKPEIRPTMLIETTGE
jgi:hypothetical protein